MPEVWGLGLVQARLAVLGLFGEWKGMMSGGRDSSTRPEGRSATGGDPGAEPGGSTRDELREYWTSGDGSKPLDPYETLDGWFRHQYAELGLKLICQAGQRPWWDIVWRWRMTRDGKRLLREARRLGWTEDEMPERPCG